MTMAGGTRTSSSSGRGARSSRRWWPAGRCVVWWRIDDDDGEEGSGGQTHAHTEQLKPSKLRQLSKRLGRSGRPVGVAPVWHGAR